MLQRLTIALARVKASNTSKNSWNEICQIIHSFYQAKESTKNVYKNIINSVKFNTSCSRFFRVYHLNTWNADW